MEDRSDLKEWKEGQYFRQRDGCKERAEMGVCVISLRNKKTVAGAVLGKQPAGYRNGKEGSRDNKVQNPDSCCKHLKVFFILQHEAPTLSNSLLPLSPRSTNLTITEFSGE